MDERGIERTAFERPIQQTTEGVKPRTGVGLEDPRALTILTTEHWSLLSARALVYNESFTRVGMFLTFLSATLVALGLLSTATGFNRDFLMVAAITFAVDLFIGLVTLGRVNDASGEDLRYLAGMNRLRHAYHEMVPGLARYFVSSQYDDQRGLLSLYAPQQKTISVTAAESLRHGLTTIAGLMIVLCAVVLSVLVDVVLLLLTNAAVPSAIGAVVALIAGLVYMTVREIRMITRLMAGLRPEFPSPDR